MKKITDNIAEIIIVALTIVALSSCSFNNKAEAQELTIEEYYSSIDCENCDEID